MGLLNGLSTVSAALRRATSIEAVAHALLGLGVEFGFSGLRIIRVADLSFSPSWNILARFGSSSSDNWAPVVSKACDHHMPFFHDPNTTGGQSSLVVPIRESGRLVWIVCFLGADDDESSETILTAGASAHAAYAAWRSMASRTVTGDGELTQREGQCMDLVAQGKTDGEIGRLLGIAPRTVRFHMQNAKAKLRAGSRTQAVAFHVAGL